MSLDLDQIYHNQGKDHLGRRNRRRVVGRSQDYGITIKYRQYYRRNIYENDIT